MVTAASYDVKTIAIGVDIGQRVDPTAIAVVEHDERETGRTFMERVLDPWGLTDPADVETAELETLYTVRSADRLPLNTAYPQVAATLAGVVENVVRMREHEMNELAAVDPAWAIIHPRDRRVKAERLISIYVDATGVGRPVVDILREALRDYRVSLTAVTFVHGELCDVSPHKREGKLGKAHLVSRLQALFQTNRIQIPRKLKYAREMKDELLDYEIKVSEEGKDTYGAFKVGAHDDLVTALGLAVLVDPRAHRVTTIAVDW